MPNTVQFHQVLRTTPERLYRAFVDADAMVKWLPPHGFTAKMHHMDARMGGTYKMSFTNFTTGKSHSFGGEYLELIPHERLRWTDRFDDPNLPGEAQVTIKLKAVSCGTELSITQEGVPAVIPPEACYLGWQESLTLLANRFRTSQGKDGSWGYAYARNAASRSCRSRRAACGASRSASSRRRCASPHRRGSRASVWPRSAAGSGARAASRPPGGEASGLGRASRAWASTPAGRPGRPPSLPGSPQLPAVSFTR